MAVAVINDDKPVAIGRWWALTSYTS